MLQPHVSTWAGGLPLEPTVRGSPIDEPLTSPGAAPLTNLASSSTNRGIPRQDCYGFRVYTRGAWLLSHVDRESTHALSLVINVAQIGVEEPWPLEVRAH